MFLKILSVSIAFAFCCVAGCVEHGINLQNIPEGMYKVGKDIPAGEYQIISDNNGSFVVYRNSGSPEAKNMVNFGFIDGQKYVSVFEGQYLQIKRSHALKVD